MDYIVLYHVIQNKHLEGVNAMVRGEPNRSLDGLLTPTEVAERLGMSRPYIYFQAASGVLPSIRFGKAVRFHPEDVERFIQRHRRDHTSRKSA